MDKIDKKHFISRGCPCLLDDDKGGIPTGQMSCGKLHATDWLKECTPPDIYPHQDVVEVRFKNSRKDFFRADPALLLEVGDIVAVESSPGHDIGIVSLTGEVVGLQLKKKKYYAATDEFRRVYRKAKVSDIEKWASAVRLEDDTMHQSRGMAASLKLRMKISDVEYQGDRTKAIFYYTADERVDFRELIKVLADAFHVRIELRQIGMRQEASRLGGIGTCGRELCCSTWLTQFRSVSTNAARTQQLSLNPQKLAGQCSKLKCCINYENDTYIEALKDFPSTSTDLVTMKGTAQFFKIDVLGRYMGYTYKDNPGQVFMIPVERVREIISMNRNKKLPPDLLAEDWNTSPAGQVHTESEPNLEDSLTRFDKPTQTKKKRKRRGRSNKSTNSK